MAVKEYPHGVNTGSVFHLTPSHFRNSIPSQHFPAEKGRYVLYFNYCCPWAHRTTISLGLKGLGDVVQAVEVDSRDPARGWYFAGRTGPDRDPIYGFQTLRDLYHKADPQYSGRITVPMLWDKKHETIVNNESSEIARMFLEGFDELLPPEQREVNKGEAAYYPRHLRSEIDAFNAFIYDSVNNGVYKIGFASSQKAYDLYITKLFDALDRIEYHLGEGDHQPYLFGEHVTEADIRLFTTLIRFDVSYYTLFKCNLKMIRLDYPRLHRWLRNLYWNDGPETAGGVFRKTTDFEIIKWGYSFVSNGNSIVPAGPDPPIMPL